jgi:hypothetical protein
VASINKTLDWKGSEMKLLWPNLMNSPGTCLVGLNKIVTNFGKNSRPLDLNRGNSTFETGELIAN